MTAVIGLDFGTESARALVVDVHDGRILGSGVAAYRHGVIDEQLPSTGAALGAEWALQDPGDWLEALETSVREAFSMDIMAVVVREVCYGGNKESHEWAMNVSMKMFARIRTLEQALAMLRA